VYYQIQENLLTYICILQSRNLISYVISLTNKKSEALHGSLFFKQKH